MPNNYEHSYQHDLDNVIDASDAVLAIGNEKVDTTTLKDRSLNGNDATIHGAMPSNGYFLGRTFDGDDDYLDCGNDGSLGNNFTFIALINQNTTPINYNGCITRDGSTIGNAIFRINSDNHPVLRQFGIITIQSTKTLTNGKNYVIEASVSDKTVTFYVNGKNAGGGTFENSFDDTGDIYIGRYTTKLFDGEMKLSCIYNVGKSEYESEQFFNSIARLSLYSHNFEKYPNSDTSLTTIFPYTSGIITSGAFNKTDGLKCTSAGTIIFSNNFEFDGSEYLTLTIDGVEYSGTTTVTQGTITATIAQGSNDITIEMGTNDVLEDIQIQFRSEV